MPPEQAPYSSGAVPKPSPVTVTSGAKFFQSGADTSWAVPPPPSTPIPPLGATPPFSSFPASAINPAAGGRQTNFRSELKLLREHQARTQRYLAEQSKFLNAVGGAPDQDAASSSDRSRFSNLSGFASS